MNRCILCYRCVKVARQITDHRVHGVMNSGDVSEISTYIQKPIENEFSGNMIDVCPGRRIYRQNIPLQKPRMVYQAC